MNCVQIRTQSTLATPLQKWPSSFLSEKEKHASTHVISVCVCDTSEAFFLKKKLQNIKSNVYSQKNEQQKLM